MVVVIDPQNSGIAGNMVLGALVDMGLNPESLIDVMEHYASYFGDINVKISDVKKAGISATYVDVECHDKEAIRYTELLERLDKIKH
jgi:pyridinium-3,5-bisthiocarboxylic acid mononucleotide nickel chelatase